VLVANGATVESKRLADGLEAHLSDSLSDTDRKNLLKVRVRVAVSEGSGEDEISMLEAIVSLDPLDGEALILLGQNHARAGDYEKAVFYYERAEGLEKYEAEALVRHAQVLVQQRKYNEALPLLRNALRIEQRTDVQDFLEQVERVAKSR
jgi:tetratricopeptide (TPR) repeat protein